MESKKEYENLQGWNLKDIEKALLTGSSGKIGLSWHCFTDDVQRLIAGGYELGLNPLPHLRKVFPNFTWKFHQLNCLSSSFLADLRRIVARSDYFWPATYNAEERFVTARRKKSDEPPWRILGSDTILPDSIGRILEKVQAVRVHPLLSEESDEESD